MHYTYYRETYSVVVEDQKAPSLSSQRDQIKMGNLC